MNATLATTLFVALWKGLKDFTSLDTAVLAEIFSDVLNEEAKIFEALIKGNETPEEFMILEQEVWIQVQVYIQETIIRGKVLLQKLPTEVMAIVGDILSGAIGSLIKPVEKLF
jgi:hypothetical protein